MVKMACAALALAAFAAGASAQQLKQVAPDASGQCPSGAVRSVVNGLARCAPKLVGSRLPGSSTRGVALAAAPAMARSQGAVAKPPKDFVVAGATSAADAKAKAAASVAASNAAAVAAGQATPVQP